MFWVCTTVSNSPNPPRVLMRLCKHEKSALLLFFKTHWIKDFIDVFEKESDGWVLIVFRLPYLSACFLRDVCLFFLNIFLTR